MDESNSGFQVFVSNVLQDALPDFNRDVVGIERHRRREEKGSEFVVFADNPWRVRHSVKYVLELRFDESALFLNNDDAIQPLREFAESFGIQWPRQCDLEEAQPQPLRTHFVNAQLFKREPDIHE